ncbi:glycosyltransferase family 2 protein [Enterovirga aerilata]|uniref:Glycosyltransferase family 2 protein n=1 Tax=Enterovirga aerilata TaxID=2730920 RepID=A0A849I8Q5_9HYPH|nr:glycosyltransferase family 2 protein [Enterovirga sp. DB1703]NNM72675.1 glycosyltransferase family 2 protein [Enterovirga sp. DB1703]
MNEPRTDPEISVVVPIFREAESVGPLCRRLVPVLERVASSFEILFVDDGSTDDTLLAIRAENARDPRIKAVSFSRNFGKEIAIAAGLDHARGRAVVIMDADLQHPPETIEAFVAKWREGYVMVYGQRTDRAGESPVKRGFTQAFYRLFARFGETELPEGAGDFRLIDRKGVEVLRSLGERARFSKGLYAWIGFPSVGVPFVVEERQFGTTKWSFRKLFRFAFDGITSFSTVPLRVWTYLGGLISLLSIAAAIYFAVRTLLFGSDVPGYPSLIVSVTFFSGIQLMSLGMIGEYVGRIFAEVKRRPLYVVADTVGGSGEASPVAEARLAAI